MTAAAGLAAQTQASIVRDGSEYNVALTQGDYLIGDQAHPDLALGATGGYVVWQDNIGDTDGLSVNARRVTTALSGELGIISLATKTAGNQEHPKAALLSNGGAAFTWQGGPAGAQQIFVRVMNSAGVFLGEETAASVRTDAHQIRPSITALSNGNFVVVWGADGPDGSMQGVYGMLYGPTGARLGVEFQINQFTLNNQRNPVVSGLADGGFAVAWVSEGERSGSSVDVYGRIYNASGAAKGGEFRVNASNRVASSPTIATTSAGNFSIAWCEISQDPNVVGDQVFGEKINSTGDSTGWDVYASGFSPDGTRLVEPTRVNQVTAGSQRNPSIASVGSAQMVVWTSYGQDGDREGIVGRALNGIGAPIGDESVVNSHTIGEQLYPVVKGDGDARFVACWSSFVGVAAGTELRAQRFLGVDDGASLPPPGAPHVSALSHDKLSVTWGSVDGYNVAKYLLYMDGSATPLEVAGQMTTITRLASSRTVAFQLAYRLSDGQVSPRSAETTGRTWSEDATSDGLPDDWQRQYWGANWFLWPSPSEDSDRDGVSNWNEFLAGTDPTDSQSVLRTQFIGAGQNMRLQWNTVPGQMYQVKQTTDFVTWQDFGGQRFATGTTDSVSVPAGNSLGYYRVTRIR
jgi:hypothetical protein